ncbi:hypothetical protein MSG28_012649 [Choristoneura fumiferana]|uniref:Uncharacterized protein n=1 Tax=Choristoneura fumiferana TaxID=7141 RepID=A0ACC0JHI1_CHOFU|nr:hypothetical protein MSG28_012649 [Choristoneura fumiferana]
MIHNNEVRNTEDNGNKPRTDGDRDVTVPNEKFLYREPIVLITIVCLPLLNALSFYHLNNSEVETLSMYIRALLYSLSASAVSLVGLMFAAFLSEVTGRKHIVLGLICLGSTWAWPESPYWLANKGKLEQSRAAFMWLRGNGGREELASVLKARRRPGPPKLFWISLLIAIATILVSTFSHLQVVLSTMAYRELTSEIRGCIWAWPESPYWLANKGNLEQSRAAFMWLRAKEAGRSSPPCLRRAAAPAHQNYSGLVFSSLLPQYREQIAATLSASRVSVLVGAAGCGKSSRAPVAALRGSADATVLVAGPRRVAAIGLARRVASELGEQLYRRVTVAALVTPEPLYSEVSSPTTVTRRSNVSSYVSVLHNTIALSPRYCRCVSDAGAALLGSLFADDSDAAFER